GGCLFIAEEFLLEYGNNGYIASNFNDILIFRIGKLGNLVWAKNINKHQKEVMFGGKLLSCSTMVNNENSYVFFNERKNVKPIDNTLSFQQNKFGNINEKNSNLYMVKLDGSGNISCDAIHLNRYNDIMFYPVNGKSSYNSQMVIFGSNEKEKQFLTFKLN